MSIIGDSVSFGGGSGNIASLSVTENGTYTASGNVDGYSPVVVNVSGSGSGGPFSLRVLNANGDMIWNPNNIALNSYVEYPSGLQYPDKIYIEPAFTPPPVEIVTWANGTDAQIAAMVAALDAGTLTLEQIPWAVGDERTVSLSAMSATGVGESHAAQTVTLVLMDSGHYTFATPTAAGRTVDHFVVGLKNCLNEAGYMNSSGTNEGSWNSCARRTWCNDVFRVSIPETLRMLFKQFNVVTATSRSGSGTTTSVDYFTLFAEKEIFGSRTESNSAEADALTQIQYYQTSSNRVKTVSGSAQQWWERSPYYDSGTGFCAVGSNGEAGYNYWANNTIGLAPFGCI